MNSPRRRSGHSRVGRRFCQIVQPGLDQRGLIRVAIDLAEGLQAAPPGRRPPPWGQREALPAASKEARISGSERQRKIAANVQ